MNQILFKTAPTLVRLPVELLENGSIGLGVTQKQRGNTVANWSDFTDIVRDPKHIEVSVAGVAYEGRAVIARQVKVGERVLLDRDVGNPHDLNAVAVVRALDGSQLGYLPRDVSARVAAVIDQINLSPPAVVTDLIGMDRADVPPAVHIYFELLSFDLP